MTLVFDWMRQEMLKIMFSLVVLKFYQLYRIQKMNETRLTNQLFCPPTYCLFLWSLGIVIL